MKTSELMNEIKADPKAAEKLLYPGNHIAEYNVDRLKIEVLRSGFKSFDDRFVFKKDRGELIFIGARPSQGKSALMLQIATNIADYGKAHVISLEDGHEAMATRQTAGILNVPMDMIQRGLVDKSRLLMAQEQLARLNMVIDDRGGLNVHQICDAVRMQHKKSPTTAVFIDYIQIIKSDRKVSRTEDLGTISGALKALAMELKIPVVVTSQLSRNSEYGDRPPQMSDLRDSGSLEQDADVVLLIHRKGVDSDIIVAKNKNGPTGIVSMKYAGAQCRFIDSVRVIGGDLG